MKIPYGLSNFKNIISEGYLYIDKTAYIETLEQEGSFNILLRPRRFGKSLFLSTLWHYYDIRSKDAFEGLFGRLAIGKNPTPLQNSYQILFMEFSGISIKDEESIERDFAFEVSGRLRNFLEEYQYPAEDQELFSAIVGKGGFVRSFYETIKTATMEGIVGLGSNFGQIYSSG